MGSPVIVIAPVAARAVTPRPPIRAVVSIPATKGGNLFFMCKTPIFTYSDGFVEPKFIDEDENQLSESESYPRTTCSKPTLVGPPYQQFSRANNQERLPLSTQWLF